MSTTGSKVPAVGATLVPSLLIGALLVGAPAAAAAPTAVAAAAENIPGTAAVTVRITPRQPSVGQPVTAELTVLVDAETASRGAPRFPDWGDTWGDAHVLAADPPREQPPVTAGRDGAPPPRRFVQQVALAAFEPGPIELPPVAVGLADGTRWTTPSRLSFTVQSLLPPAPELPDPRPAAGLLPVTGGATPWLAWLVLLAAAGALAVLALLLRRRWRRSRDGGQPNAIADPWSELTGELAGLGRLADARAEDHAALSRAVRRYLGRRLSFPALACGGREIRDRLTERHLPAAAVEELGALLSACDLVKFAGRPALPGALATAGEAVRRSAAAIEEHLTGRPPGVGAAQGGAVAVEAPAVEAPAVEGGGR